MLKIIFLALAVLALTEAVKLKKSKNLGKRPEFAKRQDSSCPEGIFQCTSAYERSGEHLFTCGNGQYIPIYRVCDHHDDCADRSDEFGCEYASCAADQVRCDNHKCIYHTWLCDRDNDCGTGWDEDEENCATLHPSICSDVMALRDCVVMNETIRPICLHDELGFKYCRKYCNLCQDEA